MTPSTLVHVLQLQKCDAHHHRSNCCSGKVIFYFSRLNFSLTLLFAPSPSPSAPSFAPEASSLNQSSVLFFHSILLTEVSPRTIGTITLPPATSVAETLTANSPLCLELSC